MAQKLGIEETRRGDSLTISPYGVLDSQGAALIAERVMVARLSGIKHFVLDLAEVEFLAGMALHALARLAISIENGDGGFAFCNLFGPVREVVDLSGFVDSIRILEDLVVPPAEHSHAATPGWPAVRLAS